MSLSYNVYNLHGANKNISSLSLNILVNEKFSSIQGVF